MTTLRTPCAAVIVTSTALNAAAQSRLADVTSAPVTTAVSAPMDCAKPVARHDHAAERGMPKTRSMEEPCPPVKAASVPKSKLTYDHAKFHENQ